MAAYYACLMWTVLLKVWSSDQQQNINRKLLGMQIPGFHPRPAESEALGWGPAAPQVMLILVQCENTVLRYQGAEKAPQGIPRC